MKCMKCNNDFEEKDIQSSHDIPKYIGGTDLDGRHWLCKRCHKEYEYLLLDKFLSFLGEEFIEGEEREWIYELKKQSEKLKKEFREIAKKIKEVYFNGGFEFR